MKGSEDKLKRDQVIRFYGRKKYRNSLSTKEGRHEENKIKNGKES